LRIGTAALLSAVVFLCAGCLEETGPTEPDTSVAPIAGVHSIAVLGTRFVVVLDSGVTLDQQELVGAILTLDSRGRQYRLRIDATRADPGDIQLYELSAEDGDSGQWHNLCTPDPAGERLAFPLQGIWTSDGRHLPSDTEFSITCTSGAEGKCVRFGYKPWEHLPDGSSLWDYHQACTRLLRADYCGDGHPHTRNGTPVDLYDRFRIQADEPAPGMSFEAAWGPQGAVCVRRPRYTDLAPLATLAQQCPALKGRLGDGCSDHAAALLYDKSFPQPP